jgi:hypothetical protein
MVYARQAFLKKMLVEDVLVIKRMASLLVAGDSLLPLR